MTDNARRYLEMQGRVEYCINRLRRVTDKDYNLAPEDVYQHLLKVSEALVMNKDKWCPR